MYSCRGDKDRYMSISEYLDTVKPYLFALIDEKRIYLVKRYSYL